MLAGAPSASADTLEVASPGARGLASAGGWLAWSEPAAGIGGGSSSGLPVGWCRDRRSPPSAPSRRSASARTARRWPGAALLAVYARCAGESAVEGCDVHALDLRAGTERRVERLASELYSETSPDVVFGRFVLVSRGGRRPGIYTYDPSAAIGRPSGSPDSSPRTWAGTGRAAWRRARARPAAGT